jgi:predicted O-methyltransferase YrrM
MTDAPPSPTPEQTLMQLATCEAVAEAYDFSKARHVVDVGGGHGILLAAIVRRYPGLRATLYDLPEVTAEAPAALAARGVAEPLEIVGGDFFARVPAGADAYVMKMILHDLDDDRAAAILVRCREAMARGGRVLICEQVIGVGADTPGGSERTGAEFATLAARAGLRIRRFVPTTSPIVVIECVAA